MSTTRTFRSLALLCLVLASCAAPGDAPFTKKPKKLTYPRVSGAYRALSFWGESRAYPGRDLPPDAYGRAWERAAEAVQPAFVSPGVQVGRPQPDPGGQWRPLGPSNNGGRSKLPT